MIVSWFSSAYSRVPFVVNMTFNELEVALRELSSTPREANDASKLNAIMLSSAIYAPECARSIENALGAEFAAMDFDAGDWTMFAAGAWCRAKGFTHIIHSTTKCRPRHHRFRLLLFFSRRVSVEEYGNVWRAIADMLPSKPDPAAKDVTRLSIAPYAWIGAFNFFDAASGLPLDIDSILSGFRPPSPEVFRAPSVIFTGRSALSNAYAAAAIKAEIETVRTALPGARNATLHRAAFSLGQLVAAGLLDHAEVAESLLSVSSLPECEARGAIKNGLDAGLRRPRT